jgi:hypothetical protein
MPESVVCRAMKKCSPFQGKTWCGYLLPVEIVALASSGAVISDGEAQNVVWAEQEIAKGHSGGRWFYFGLGKLKPHGQSKKTNGHKAHQRHCQS